MITYFLQQEIPTEVKSRVEIDLSCLICFPIHYIFPKFVWIFFTNSIKAWSWAQKIIFMRSPTEVLFLVWIMLLSWCLQGEN